MLKMLLFDGKLWQKTFSLYICEDAVLDIARFA